MFWPFVPLESNRLRFLLQSAHEFRKPSATEDAQDTILLRGQRQHRRCHAPSSFASVRAELHVGELLEAKSHSLVKWYAIRTAAGGVRIIFHDLFDCRAKLRPRTFVPGREPEEEFIGTHAT
jgi:hypothetical protein